MSDVANWLSELDDHGFEDTSSDRKVAILNDTVADVCSREPWPFLEDQATVTLNADTVTLPTDFRAALTFIVPSIGQVLTPERLDAITRNYAASLTGKGVPIFYYFIGETMKVLPVPDQSYTGLLNYLRNHPTITADTVEADILIPPRHHRVVVLGTLAKLFAMEDDEENAPLFMQQYEARLKTMENDVWKKQYDRPDREIDLGGFWDSPWF